MGEVYRARDTRLDRTVAIKILPAALAADPQMRDRFDREARAISSLSHPHICALYDVGRQDGVDFLVLEYLEGETLAARLARTGDSEKAGLLPADALRYAIEICDALDKAHRSGVIHRDLKPANVMLTKSGAKLLDFGLAKSSAPVVVATSGLSMLPTTPPHLTAQGTILGTFQYMAPEQIEGLEADARTDIFAFGALLFEMVTGRPAFEGKTRASLLGAILKDEPPPVSRLQPLAPKPLDRIV
jgi:serine/threonine protein kinase